MSELIIHIGAHKTATTALQQLLSESARHLAQFGIVYPKIAWFLYAQHRLAFGFKNIIDPVRGDLPDPMTEISQLNALLAKNRDKRILVSSEELFALRPEAMDFLKTHLVATKIRIIACVRRPDEMLLSIYNQKAKSPDNTFAWPLAHFPPRPRHIDPDIAYGMQLTKWMDRFGDDNLSVFTYEEGKPIDSFFRLLGIDVPPEKEPVVNTSVPAPVVEIMRLAKAFDFNPALLPKLYHAAMKQFPDAPRLSLSHEQRREILTMMEQEYDALFARLGRKNPYPPSILETPSTSDDPAGQTPAPPPLTFRDMMAFVETLIR